MTKRIINLLFFIVLNVFAASLSGIIPLFSHSANAEAGLAILSVTCQPYDGLVVATNDESPDFRIDENTVALFDGDKKIGLSVDECTPVACGEVGIPLDSSFSAPDNLKVVFGKGFAVSENGARLADEEIWIYESFEEEFSLIRFRKESPADDNPDEFADESESESLSESESYSESESESLSESESSSESESESLSESESSSESESESLPESESSSESESESLHESESSSESESYSESESEDLPESESSSESESENLSESESFSESESESGTDESESLPTSERDSDSESKQDSESLPESESYSDSESPPTSESSSDSESPPTSESRTKDESNRTPTSENRESGCKSDIYPCMTTGLFATFTASAFIFFNNKKQ